MLWAAEYYFNVICFPIVDSLVVNRYKRQLELEVGVDVAAAVTLTLWNKLAPIVYIDHVRTTWIGLRCELSLSLKTLSQIFPVVCLRFDCLLMSQKHNACHAIKANRQSRFPEESASKVRSKCWTVSSPGSSSPVDTIQFNGRLNFKASNVPCLYKILDCKHDPWKCSACNCFDGDFSPLKHRVQ